MQCPGAVCGAQCADSRSVACVGILIYINTGSRARDASSGVGGDLQRIKLDDSMDTSNTCLKGMLRSTPYRSRSNDFACTKNISSCERIKSRISGGARGDSRSLSDAYCDQCDHSVAFVDEKYIY